MFKNPGKLVKIVAKTFFGIVVAASVIAAIAAFASDGDFVWIGFLCLLAGPLAAWLIALFIYSFGELVERAGEIAENTAGGKPQSKPKSKPQEKPRQVPQRQLPLELSRPVDIPPSVPKNVCEECGAIEKLYEVTVYRTEQAEHLRVCRQCLTDFRDVGYRVET